MNDQQTITLEDGEYKVLDISVGELSEKDKRERNSFPVKFVLQKVQPPQRIQQTIFISREKQ